MSVLDLFRLDFLLPTQSSGQVGSTFSVMGVARVDFSFPLFDFTSSGSSLLVRGSYRLDSRLSVCSSVRFDSSLLVLDFVNPGSTSSVGTLRIAGLRLLGLGGNPKREKPKKASVLWWCFS